MFYLVEWPGYVEMPSWEYTLEVKEIEIEVATKRYAEKSQALFGVRVAYIDYVPS